MIWALAERSGADALRLGPDGGVQGLDVAALLPLAVAEGVAPIVASRLLAAVAEGLADVLAQAREDQGD